MVTFSYIQCDNGDDYRYNMIRSLFDQYERQFTMLDIGAAQGYYSLRTARDYDAVCVIIEGSDQILDICKEQRDLENIILLHKNFTPNELQHLSECEDFDVVLALNFLHKFGEQWQETFDVILHLGDHIIIEIPSQHLEMENYIIAKGGCYLGSVLDADSILYIVESRNKCLQRKTWLRLPMKNNLYNIQSSFTHKELSKPCSWPKNTFQVSPWLAGINLVTFKICHGAYPTKETLQESLLSITDDKHTDWLINNMIIQGDNLITIDGYDDASRAFFSQDLLVAHQELLDLEDPFKVEHYFWKKLVNISLSRRQFIKFLGQLFPSSTLLFNIGCSDEVLVDRYLCCGAKVIYLNSDQDEAYELRNKFKQDDFIVASNTLLTQKSTIDTMILRYGIPKFCIIDQPEGSVSAILKTLSQPIACIACKFDVRFQDDFIACLDHLVHLGYTKFNFSACDIPCLILEPNKYTGTHKEWARSVDELLYEMDEFLDLDHDPKNLWGFVYAKM